MHHINFTADAIAPSEHAPVFQRVEWHFDTQAHACDAIAAIWQSEATRLLKLAHSIVRACGGDEESIVSDAYMRVAVHWSDMQDEAHVRRTLYTVTRNLAVNAIHATRSYVPGTSIAVRRNEEIDPTMGEPTEQLSAVEARTIAWVLEQCSETERRILQIYLQPGNSTTEATAKQTERWAHPWSIHSVQRLFIKLRKQLGVKRATHAVLGTTTKGTLPGWHWQRHAQLNMLTLLFKGPRPLTLSERRAQRVRVPRWILDDVSGRWQCVEEVVYA